MNEGKARAEAEEGRKAAKLLEDLAPYFDALEEQIIKAWRHDDADAGVREQAWHRLKAAGWVRDQIRLAIERGQYAERLLQQN